MLIGSARVSKTDWQAQLQQLDTQVGILTKQYAHIAADYKALADLLAKA